jgi:hypothetical protein
MRDSNEVFVQAVEDRLKGKPNARHPVQFKDVSARFVIGLVSVSKCTLCHSLVLSEDADDHRKWHDEHVKVHDSILAQAKRHVPEPRYGGR